ncbi:MAG TPA: UvrD-helicase domain-containing protein [Planctomycetota bacterium]|nr:UvrD-helicase domain-containing protein [Planctomycetota bacterium]
MNTAEALLQDLNPAQREAVLHRGSPLLVVAGAGSGKTRVVTRRIAHLVASGEHPGAILAVTFTNKAAGEMKERVAGLLQAEAPRWVSTFHSMAAKMLRIEGGGLRRTRDFTIYDDDDTSKVIKAVAGEQNLDDREFHPRVIRAAIDRWKSEGLRPDEVKEGSYRDRVLATAYRLYEQKLELANALDFNDLLLELVRLFEGRAEVLEGYRRRFRHVLVDEYQDTNAVQYRLVRLLAGDGRSLCAVGDPDQSIYAWRGARIENILDFEKSFPGTRVVRLEQNYRSTAPILSAAAALISRNRQRIERGLWTEKAGGAAVELFTAIDEEHEAEEVVRRIAGLRSHGRKLAECAVFFRTNAQSRAFEEAFLRNSVPYVLVSGTAFYQRAEVKDALAYLRLAVNPRDEISFDRAVNWPPRGVGDGAVERLRAEAARLGLSSLEAARSPEARSALPPRARAGLEGFVALLDGLGGPTAYPVEPAVRRVLTGAGLLARFTEDEESERVENLNELAAAAGEYDEVNPDGSLAGFLEQVALVSSVDDWDGSADRVSLMTLHAAKGLEFPAVFVTGLEEGLLPHMRTQSEGSAEDREEERRLLYVGMTRAREELVLTWARSRRRFGPSQPTVPSSFIRELPAKEIRPPGAVDRALLHATEAAARDWESPVRRWKPQASDRPSAPPWEKRPKADSDGRYIEEEAVMEAARSEGLGLAAGDLVVHDRFGSGRVEAIEGFGETARITVAFSGYGRKKLVAGYAKLRKA